MLKEYWYSPQYGVMCAYEKADPRIVKAHKLVKINELMAHVMFTHNINLN